MKLSACIFTYNHEPFIGQAIESVLCQRTDFDYELVIGEDCSSDSTRDIVERYQEQYPSRIRAFFNPANLGIMQNNSQTILRCKGEYIALLDGDDVWSSEGKLQAQVNFLENNPDYAFCFHDVRVMDMKGKIDAQWTCCAGIKKDTITLTDVIYDVSIPTCSIVFRKKALVGYPPTWFNRLNAPDRPLFLLLTAQGPGYYFNEEWALYRKHPGGHWTGQNYQSQWLTLLQIYSVMDPHFNYRYSKEFTRSRSRVSYNLALQLIKKGRVKRAVCFIKRYVRSKKNGSQIPRVEYFINLVRFWTLYLTTLIRPPRPSRPLRRS